MPKSPNIFEYTDYRAYLKDYFDERKTRDAKFSHRYFARRLGLSSPTFIMLVMQGKRNISQTVALRISEELKHGKREAEYFENLVAFSQASTNKEKDRHFSRILALRHSSKVQKIEEWQYEYCSKWYNVAIRELVTYPQFKGDYKWLANKLVPRITETQARHSVELLLKLRLIQKNGTRYERTSALVSTGPQVNSLAVSNFHRAMAHLAAQTQDTVAKHQRDNTACTVNISDKGFEQIREALADCRKRVLSIAETDTPADSVYQLSLHFFPLSNRES